MTSHDAVVLTSFGGPEAHDEVMPFLRRVVAGRGVPDERLADVAEHYHANGGRSPINDQNRALVAALSDEFARRGLDLPILFGNRNSEPFLADTLRDAARDGQSRLLALVTSAYSSYSGCRQYREDLAGARDEAVEGAGVDVTVDKVRVFFNHPGFVTAQAERVRSALADLDADEPARTRLVFVTHSIPLSMARHCDYQAQHYEACRLVAGHLADRVGGSWSGDWDLVYCSRSGPPSVPWLAPDVNDHLVTLSTQDVPAVVVVPIGFVSDHMEVIHDLDVEAAETADDLDLEMARAGTVGTHPAFVTGLADLVAERVADGPRLSLGTLGPWHDACPLDCCRVPDRDYPPTVADAPLPRPRG